MKDITLQLLAQHNVKPTPMRMLVLEQLQLQKKALSLTEIELLLKPADRITIYRTLKTFEQHGLVHSVDGVNNVPLFLLCEDDCTPEQHQDQHPHFYCETCGELTCVEDFCFQLEMKTPKAGLFTVRKSELRLSGVCANCNGL